MKKSINDVRVLNLFQATIGGPILVRDITMKDIPGEDNEERTINYKNQLQKEMWDARTFCYKPVGHIGIYGIRRLQTMQPDKILIFSDSHLYTEENIDILNQTVDLIYKTNYSVIA